MTESRSKMTRVQEGVGEFSLYAIPRVLLQYRYLILGVALGLTVLTVGLAMLGPRKYTAASSFIPQSAGSRAQSGGLVALAGQLGLGMASAEPTQSPQFYADLLSSREILGRLVTDTFAVSADPRTETAAAQGTLADFLAIDESDPELRRERTLRALPGLISTATTATGMVRIEVTTQWAELSRDVAHRLVELVHIFNLETRQSTAAVEGRFIEERLRETEKALRLAEDELRAFLESNRQFQNSPQLIFEHDRLRQGVSHHQQLYTGLQESLENARIAQVRDTPLITVIENAERPVYPDSRRIPLRALLALLVGAMVGILIGFLREVFEVSADDDDPEYARLRRVWNDVRRSVGLGRSAEQANS
jgi:uncharacterized protein involved in exopolysaccharide biosynthesis